MDEITRMQTLCSLLPSDLRERITSQLTSSSLTYATMREFALSQVARRSNEANRKRTPELLDLDVAEYGDGEWDEDQDYPACFWTTPAGRWAFAPARKGKGKGQGGKGKKGKASAAE